jgi:outer membrane protein insertion porin family
VGYSQSQGVLFNASVTQNNFLGTGKRVSMGLNTSSAVQLYQLAYTNPYYTVDGISRGFNVAYRATDFDELIGADYTTDVGTVGMNFGLPISETSRFGFGARYQYTKFKAGLSQIAQEFEEENGDIFNDVLLFASYSSDTRDTAIFPTRGGLRGVRADFSVPGSDLQYYKVTYQDQQYVPLTQRFVFSLSGDVGYGDGYGDTQYLPFFENFYAGGPRSVRGFVANSLGPRDLQFDDPVGGNLRMAGSLELFAPPPIGGTFEKTLRLGAFFDVGNVWETRDSDLVAPTGLDFGELRYSTGLSATWLSPIGALSVSFAVPLKEEEGDETQVFQFNIGQTF